MKILLLERFCKLITAFFFVLGRFGDVSLQETINQENFELLKEYYAVFMEKMPPDCKYISSRT